MNESHDPSDGDLTSIHDAATAPPGPPPCEQATQPAPRPAQPTAVPGYEILRPLGRGGMGVVYQARHLRLNRVVALKMILAGGHADEATLARFQTEAEAVARLQHSNIVQIFEVGEHGGLPFLALEFCAGGGLDRKLAGAPLPAAEAAALVEKLARAVQAAHERGVVHRDLKPANVLLAEGGEPKITDFGLAKKLDAGAGQTRTGAVLGTPSYMAPEQAGGQSKEAGPAVDVYALGAILYECLTGRPPFKAATPLETLEQMLGWEPVPPRQLQPKTPRDLETVCLKCLEKQPGRRYATAADLADDLGRWRRGEPVRARPPSPGYVLGKWAWRYRAPLAVAAGMLLLLAAVATTAFVQVLGARDEAVRKGSQLQDALNTKQQTLDSLNRQLSILARSYADRGDAEYRAGHVRDSVSWLLRAYDLAPRDDPLRRSYARLMGSRGRSLSDLALWHDGPVGTAAFSPDRRLVVTASWDKTARLWDAQSGKELQRLLHEDRVSAASFSPDGRTVLTAGDDGTARLWDAASGQELQRLQHNGAVVAAAFSPDGRTVLTASHDGTARLWDAQSGKELHQFPHKDWVAAAAFSPDGRTVLTASKDKTARLWDAADGKELQRFPHESPVYMASFSPDGGAVLTADADWTARLWDARSGKELHQFPHKDWVAAASLSPDGRTVVTAGDDGSARLWDAQSGKELRRLRQEDPVRAASFSPDGRTVLTAGDDRTARLWDVESGQELQRLRHDGPVRSALFSADGRAVVTASDDKTARLWNAPDNKPLQRLQHNRSSMVTAASFSPDGRTVLTASTDDTARLWDAESGQELLRLPHELQVRAASFSRQGRTVVTASYDGAVRLWDAGSGKKLQRLPHQAHAASFSPDGRTVLTASDDHTARLWDLAAGQELLRLSHEAPVNAASFGPDGRTVLTASNDNTARRWDAQSGQELLRLSHEAAVNDAAFSPDGRTIVTASDDKTARLWDAAGKELQRLPHEGSVRAASFSPDRRTVLTASEDRTARLWDAVTGQELLRLAHVTGVSAASFSPDGRTVVTASHDETARLWDVSFLSIPEDSDVDRLRAWVLVRTGQDFTDEGALRPLSKEEWQQQRQTLEAKGGDWQPPPDPRRWHLAEAADAEAHEAWFAARFHLNWLLKDDPNNADLLRRRDEAEAHLKAP